VGRLIWGFLAAPVVAALVTVLVAVAGGAVPGVSQLVHTSDLDPSVPETVFAWALLFAGAVTLLGGVPAFGALRRRGRLTLGTHLLMGVLLGASPFLLLAVLGTVLAVADRELPAFANSILRLSADAVLGSIAGIAAAITFFLISSNRNQLRSHAA